MKPSRVGSGEGRFTLPFGVEKLWSAGSGFPPPVSKWTVSVDLGSALLVSGWSTMYVRLLVKGRLSCLPVMRMAAGPGLRAGMSACQASPVLLSFSGWPSMLADSRMGAWVVSSLAGLPGRSCPSRLHLYKSPCLLIAVTLLPAPVACT